MHIAKPLAQVFEREGVWQMTLSACPPAPGFTGAAKKAAITCEDYNARVLKQLLEGGKEKFDTVVVSASTDLTGTTLGQHFRNSLAEIKAAGIDIVIVSPTVVFHQTEKCIKLSMRTGKPLANCSFDFAQAGNHQFFKGLKNLADEMGATFLDLSELQCSNGICSISRNDTLLLRDNGHLTNESAAMVAEFMEAHPTHLKQQRTSAIGHSDLH